MILRFFLLSALFLVLNSCSMPSVGYRIGIKFSGELGRACVKKVFFASFPKARERNYVGPPELFNLWSNSVVDLKSSFNMLESIKLENGISWSSYYPDKLMLSSYFLTSRSSRKLLRTLKKNKDAVNFVSSQIYKKINNLADKVVQGCGVDVSERKIKCHSFGRNKKYFKCME